MCNTGFVCISLWPGFGKGKKGFVLFFRTVFQETHSLMCREAIAAVVLSVLKYLCSAGGAF